MNVSATVHLTLRRRLMAGHYEPGSQLKEEIVADELGVSRTPVRAAIQRLIAEGLLTPAAKRGAIVTEWRKSDAEHIFNLRIMLEGHAASLAARIIPDDEVERVSCLTDTMEEAIDRGGDGHLDVLHRANLEFHEAILANCGSAHVRMFVQTLLQFPMVIGGFYIYSEEDKRESIRQHREIIAGLRARNPEWARAGMTCHLTAAIERFRRSQP